MQRFGDVLTHLKQLFEIYRIIGLPVDERKDGNIAKTLNNVGRCWIKMQRYGDA